MFACRSLTCTDRECASVALRELGENFECSYVEHNCACRQKLTEDCVADESKDDGNGTTQEVTSTLNESINSVVLDYFQFTAVSRMKCAAHTLQLAIRDSLKKVTVALLITKILRIAATARTPKIDAILRIKMNKEAILDQGTHRCMTSGTKRCVGRHRASSCVFI